MMMGTMIRLLISSFILIQFANSIKSGWNGILGGNFINLTIYNNLNFTIVITHITYHGNCEENCDYILLNPCKTANIYISTWMYFKDVFLSYKVYRYQEGKPNDKNNIILKDSLYSVFDILPEDKKCLVEHQIIKKSLVIQTNSKEDTNIYCLDRFIDISDEIEKMQCRFDDFDIYL